MAKAFGAVDAMLVRLGEGWIHTLQGQPVFFNRPDETWYEIPAALDGWVALWVRINERFALGLDLSPLSRLAAKLQHGVPVTPKEVARCVEIVTACKRHYREMNVFDIGSLVKTQLIANKAKEMGLCA